MTLNFISGKNDFSAFCEEKKPRVIRSFIDFIFPPYCLACQERCSTKYLCPACWSACQLPDPIGRCRHCFEDLDRRGDLCSQCRKAAHLSAVRATVFDRESPAPLLGVEASYAMAGFAVLQWTQLEWPLPDAIIPMSEATALAKAFANILERPFIRALKPCYEYRENCLEEDLNLFLIDISSPIEQVQKAVQALSSSFPKRIYLLTLFPWM